jgi:hypothetical protein
MKTTNISETLLVKSLARRERRRGAVSGSFVFQSSK